MVQVKKNLIKFGYQNLTYLWFDRPPQCDPPACVSSMSSHFVFLTFSTARMPARCHANRCGCAVARC